VFHVNGARISYAVRTLFRGNDLKMVAVKTGGFRTIMTAFDNVCD
jgi:hypothetical protein